MEKPFTMIKMMSSYSRWGCYVHVNIKKKNILVCASGFHLVKRFFFLIFLKFKLKVKSKFSEPWEASLLKHYHGILETSVYLMLICCDTAWIYYIITIRWWVYSVKTNNYLCKVIGLFWIYVALTGLRQVIVCFYCLLGIWYHFVKYWPLSQWWSLIWSYSISWPLDIAIT